MAFDRNGLVKADGSINGTTSGMQNLIGNLTSLMFDHNGKLTINPGAQTVNVLQFQNNGKEPLTGIVTGTPPGNSNQVRTNSIGLNSGPVTFIESGGVSTGVFVTWDGGKKSDLITTNSDNQRSNCYYEIQ
jgi:hypothetical protein